MEIVSAIAATRCPYTRRREIDPIHKVSKPKHCQFIYIGLSASSPTHADRGMT